MSLSDALDLATPKEPGYVEVRELRWLCNTYPQLRLRWCTVRAYIDPKDISAVGQGDPGYDGFMRDRTVREKKFRCFLSDADFETFYTDTGFVPREVLMSGFISNSSRWPCFICRMMWTDVDTFYEAT